jgi:uncharacterized protein YndB with AHSA1/START domain
MVPGATIAVMRFRAKTDAHQSAFEHSIVIASTTTRVLEAFFDPHALRIWWKAVRSVTLARPLGVYAIEWEPSRERDDVLGRLGGAFHGIVTEYEAGHELLVSDAWWHSPDGDPIGPMSLEVTCVADGAWCRLRVRQSGFEEGTRWRRYYEVIGRGWMSSLEALKHYLETSGSE